MLIFGFLGSGGGYWLATAHPIIRLPVFFMGVCAGELCIRIQQGDIDACQSMYHHCTFNNTKDNFKQLPYPRKKMVQLILKILFWPLDYHIKIA